MTRKNDNVFSTRVIQAFLDAKLYEYRGLSKRRYISYCRKLWNETPIKKGYTKIIQDTLMPFDDDEYLPGIHLDHFAESVKEMGEIKEDSLTIKITDISKQIDEKFQNTFSKETVSKDEMDELSAFISENIKKIGTEGITCFGVASLNLEKGKFVKRSYNEFVQDMDKAPTKSSKEIKTYFIALFDILGFSKLVERLGIDGVVGKYDQLMKVVMEKQTYKSTVKIKIKENLHYPAVANVTIRHAYFSDTILLWAEAIPSQFSAFLSRCADLVCESINIGLPLRGAISCGEAIMYPEANKFIGHSIIEAARMESRQNWIGATLCSSIFLNNLFPEIDEELVVPCFVNHLKLITAKDSFKQKYQISPDHEKPYLTLDWIGRWEKRNYEFDFEDRLREFQKEAPKENRIYYENTFDFIFYSFAWSSQERGDFLRSKFLTIFFDKEGKVDFFESMQPDENEPVVLIFKNGLYRFGYFLPLPTSLQIKDSSIRDLYQTDFLFIDYLYGGFYDLFYQEIKTKMFNDFQSKIFIEKFPLSDLLCLDSYFFDEVKFAAWDDIDHKKAEIEKFMKKKINL